MKYKGFCFEDEQKKKERKVFRLDVEKSYKYKCNIPLITKTNIFMCIIILKRQY